MTIIGKRVLVLGSFFIIGNVSQATSCFPFGGEGVKPGNKNSVRSYSEDFQSCMLKSQRIFVLRSFSLNGKKSYLVVDPETASSQIVDSQCIDRCVDLGAQEVANSHYGQLLRESGQEPFLVQNDGITSGRSGEGKVALTIDMCPSSKGISAEVYEALISRSQVEGRAIPIGVAMTTRWMDRYPSRMEGLKKAQLGKQLQITWINHSANHRYSSKTKISENFLKLPGTDITKEVLGNEQALIEAGVTPSVYFRFPGLVSSRSLVEKITDWGLLILGSDAWLAKGESPHSGSIILIHGNRNEPIGEKKFLSYLSRMESLGHQLSSLSEVLK